VGPKVREVKFEASLTSLTTEAGTVTQVVADEGKAAKGGLRITMALPVDATTLGEGVRVEKLVPGEGWKPVSQSEVMVAPTRAPPDHTAEDLPPGIDILALAGWPRGVSFRVRLTQALADLAGRPLAEEQSVVWSIPADSSQEVVFHQTFPVSYDSIQAASDTLGGALPGGQTLLFHGLWTDPATGLAYARNRWYDPKSASWLSEDPLRDLDSPNLYAYVAWQPQMYRDPMGLCLGLDDIPCGVYASEFVAQFSSPEELWRSAKRSGSFALAELKGAALAIPRMAKGLYEVAAHPIETATGLYEFGKSVVTDFPGSMQRLGNAVVNADPDKVGEFVGETLFFSGLGAAAKSAEGAQALQKLRILDRPALPPGRVAEALPPGHVPEALPNPVANAFVDPYQGVRDASRYLRAQGVPRARRQQILQSFVVETVKVRPAGAHEFGIRYYDNLKAFEKGSYLFETFPASRESLALPPEWNRMIHFKQWRIRPGTVIIEGRAAPQGRYPGGQLQKFILDPEDLLP
jgi:RHS repeat-associated protein